MMTLNNDELIMGVQWALFGLLTFTAIIKQYRVINLSWPFGLAIVAAGIVLITASYVAHGSVNQIKLSSYPQPNPNAKLVTKGVYSRVRHPIYSGFILISIGLALIVGNLFALIVAALSVIFYCFKSSYEEGKLIEAYPEYVGYRKVAGRFLPKLRLLSF